MPPGHFASGHFIAPKHVVYTLNTCAKFDDVIAFNSLSRVIENYTGILVARIIAVGENLLCALSSLVRRK